MTDRTELRRLLDEPRGPRQYRRDHYNSCPCRDCKAMRAAYQRWWRARPAAGARVSVPVVALTAVLDQLDAAEAALARVRELHASSGTAESQGYLPGGGYGYIAPYCTGCEASDEYAVAWPCPTIRALGGAAC